MSFAVKIQRPAQATRESLTALYNTFTAADPALLVTPTSGNFVSTEEQSAELNIAASTAGVATAVGAAKTAFLARVAAFMAAITPGPLGDGVEGVALEAELTTALGALTPTRYPGAVTVEGSIEIGLAEFFSMYLCVIELQRARAFIATSLSVNSK